MRQNMRDLTDKNTVILRYGYVKTKTKNKTETETESSEREKKEMDKNILMDSCEYFREVIPKSKNGEINVYFIDKLTFRKVIDLLENQNSSLDNEDDISNVLIPLTEAALKLRCSTILEKSIIRLLEIVNINNVWKIYNGCYQYEPIARSCEQLLSGRTLDLLAQPEFLEIKPDTLAQFLKLDKMEINSELDLFKACDRYARSRENVNQRAIFRKFALPHLRLLTLTEIELFFNASFYLEPVETLYLNYHLRYSRFHLPGVEAEGLFCLNNSQRKRDGSCDMIIVPDTEILDLGRIFMEAKCCDIPKGVVHKFVLLFEAKKRIRIQRIDFFSPLSLGAEVLSQPNILKTLQEREKQKIQSSLPKVKVEFKVTVEGEAQPLMEVCQRYIVLNKWTSINLNAIVPENARVTLEVEFRGKLIFRKFNKTEDSIFECNAPSIREVVGNLLLGHSVNNEDGSVHVVDNATTVFKSVHACTVDSRPELVLEMDEARSLSSKFERMGIKRRSI